MKKYEVNFYQSTDEDEILLPVVIPPPIQSYLPISIIANIATANMKNLTWIMHNFVQLFQYADAEKVESFPVQQFMYVSQSVISCKEITKEVMSKERIDVIEDIIYCINHQHYVVIYLNENLIPNMRHYQHKAIVHSQFIFGYNREKQIFKVINFSKKSDQMEVIDVTFSDVKSNFYSVDLSDLYEKCKSEYIRKKGFQIYALQYCGAIDNIDATLNLEVIKEQIRQYLYSVNSSIYTSYFTGTLHGTWGMDVYEEIGTMLLKNMDIRCACLLYEHKVFMQYRINYLDETLAEEYSKVVKMANTFKMYCLKCMIKKKTEKPEMIIKYLEDMKSAEKNILEKLFL